MKKVMLGVGLGLVGACKGPQCPAYTGLDVVGRQWDYQHTQAFTDETGISGTSTVTIDAITENDDGSLTVDVSGEGEDSTEEPPSTTPYTTDVQFRCDAEGAWLVFAHFSGTVDAGMFGTFDIRADKDLTTYDLVALPEMSDGTTWTSTPAGTLTDAEGTETAYDDTITRTVTAVGETTVPAGTFATITLTSVSEFVASQDADEDGEPDSDGTSVGVSEAEVGLVRDDFVELVETREPE